MTLRSSDLQSDSDLDSIRNSCDVFANHYQIRLISMPTLACVCFFFYDDIFSNQGGFPIHIIYFTMKINASSTDISVLCIDREHILCSEKSRIFMEVSFQK